MRSSPSVKQRIDVCCMIMREVNVIKTKAFLRNVALDKYISFVYCLHVDFCVGEIEALSFKLPFKQQTQKYIRNVYMSKLDRKGCKMIKLGQITSTKTQK